jgi:uncharacterized protein (UPF0332 family)
MSHAKNKVKWCIQKAQKELEKGDKHRGLIKVSSNLEKAKEHIAKAEHNLKATIYLKKGGYSDWCSSTLFYTIYHCFLAILVKQGYETRNQECTFALIESMVEDKSITITLKELEKVSTLGTEESQISSTAVSIREEYQYATKLSLEDQTYLEMLNLTKEILEKTKVMMETNNYFKVTKHL